MTRRGLLLAGLGVGAAVYFPLSEAQHWWPWSETSDGTLTFRHLQEVADGMASKSPATKLAAVEATLPFLSAAESRATTAQLLIGFLRDGSNRLTQGASERAPKHISRAFEILGRANISEVVVDLREVNLSGIEASRLDASDGFALFGADLSGSVITDSRIGGSNAGQVDLSRAWLGGCTLSNWNLMESTLSAATFPGTRFNSCQLCSADLSSANFSTSTFNDCTFAGKKYQLPDAHWSPGREPSWPAGRRPPDIA